MSLHKKLKAHFSAALGGETKAASEPAPDERPHFVRDYTRMVAELKKTFPLEEAMSLAVGGSYDIIGKIERRILEHYGLRTGMAVLDMGCGSGRLSTVLSDMDIDYLGTDIVPDLLEYARTKSRKSFRFVLHTELNVPVPSNTIDIACAFSLFTHLHHHETYIYLEDVFRALKPGGESDLFLLGVRRKKSLVGFHCDGPEQTGRRTATPEPVHRTKRDLALGHADRFRDNRVR